MTLAAARLWALQSIEGSGPERPSPKDEAFTRLQARDSLTGALPEGRLTELLSTWECFRWRRSGQSHSCPVPGLGPNCRITFLFRRFRLFPGRIVVEVGRNSATG